MRQRTRFFLVVLLLMFAGNIFSQNISNSMSYAYAKKNRKIFSLNDNLLSNHLFSVIMTKNFPPESRKHCFGHPPTPVFDFLTPVAKDFSTTQLGIVCKKEFEFEKKTSIPLRLRVGSLDYTNYMEQKPNALKPQ